MTVSADRKISVKEYDRQGSQTQGQDMATKNTLLVAKVEELGMLKKGSCDLIDRIPGNPRLRSLKNCININ